MSLIVLIPVVIYIPNLLYGSFNPVGNTFVREGEDVFFFCGISEKIQNRKTKKKKKIILLLFEPSLPTFETRAWEPEPHVFGPGVAFKKHGPEPGPGRKESLEKCTFFT